MKRLLLLLLLVWAGGAAGVWYWNGPQTQPVRFRTLPVRQGDIRATVNATGTIEPEEVVDVGAQVVGAIVRFGTDPTDPEHKRPIGYGTKVDKGTVLAQLDDALYKARKAQAQSSLERAEASRKQAQAKVDQARRELDRSQKLRNRGTGMIAAQELETAQSNFEVAEAALAVAEGDRLVSQANLDEAKANLSYTTIASPVKGVIVDRRVNIGQTVVASLNAPSLFLIAKDLSKLEIWASVNENDIGSVHVGQTVRFTVGAFPHETFEGKVAQIRLNASMVQNVVTYTVAVAVDNATGKLLPYLTARLEFEVEARRGVLLVPRSALRWQPKADLVAPEARAEYNELLLARSRRAETGPAQAKADAEAVLWTASGEFVRPVHVTVGITDGVLTEVRGAGLHDGSQVVVGVERTDDSDIASFLPHTRGADKSAEKDDPKPAP
jgi:HlyD family secretion protein